MTLSSTHAAHVRRALRNLGSAGAALLAFACSTAALPLEGDGTGGAADEPSSGGTGGTTQGASGEPSTDSGGKSASTGGSTSMAGSGSTAGGQGGTGTAGTGSSGAGTGPSTGGLSGTGGTDEGGAGNEPSDPFPSHEITGEPYGDLGFDSSLVGDLDNDGYDELVMLGGSRVRDYASGTRGSVYLFYGREDFPEQISAADADAIFNGATWSVAKLGDVDGDGFADFGFTAYCDDLPNCRSTEGVHVIYGGAARIYGEHLADELGTTAVSLPGYRYAQVNGAGDVNGDGFDDILADVGDLYANGGSELNKSYLILGRAERLSASFDLGHADAVFEGATGTLAIDWGSGSAGDVDGDGYGDILVSTKDTSDLPTDGTTNLFYGGPDGFSGSYNPAEADAIFKIHTMWNMAGGFGDLDGDSYDDLAFVNWASSAHVFVVYGQAARFSGSLGLESVDFTLTPPGNVDGFGAGDVNGDGHLDLIVGDISMAGGNGAVALIPGTNERPSGERLVAAVDALLEGSEYFDPSIGGSGLTVRSWLGSAASANGDINGDGVADIVVSASGNVGGDEPGGSVYVLLGTEL